jgi:hypothetical protein
MPLLTIFSAPKSFSDPHIDIIQRNAIQSWLQLGSEVEVILIGEEPGLEQVAAEYGVKLLMNVERNEKGTPLVSSIFELARQVSASPLLAYVNADILLLPDIVGAARLVSELVDKFLVVGQRWDLDIRECLDFSEGYEQRLRRDVSARGRMHLPAGSDYFIYPRYLFADIPDFAIGRAGWDNWMIYYARHQDWLVVDGTPSIMVIHQDHDYGHLPGGKPHYTLEESLDNEVLAGGSANLYMVLDCEKQLRDGKLSPPPVTLIRSLRRGEVWLTPADGTRQGWRWRLARQFRRTRRRLTGSL